MNNDEQSMHKTLEEISEEYGSEVVFFAPLAEATLIAFEKSIQWRLPDIFRYFYLEECNGLRIDNNGILGFYDQNNKKTWVDNLERLNNPQHSPWFKGRSHIFEDYVIVGENAGILFCLSKKYDFPNPALYMCTNPNNNSGVDFSRLNLDLEHLIKQMVINTYEIDATDMVLK